MDAPFPYFGGKSSIAHDVWLRLGAPKQYIEPFCGSAAMLLAAPRPASLEIVSDQNGFIANFWRATKYQPAAVAEEADYPVSHVDLGARHAWLMDQRQRLGVELQDPLWIGDARVAGWWLWGQCSWIGSGWCEWNRVGGIPHSGNAGMGIQAVGKVPQYGDPGRGIQAVGQVPHYSDPGRGIQAVGQVPQYGDPGRGIQAVGLPQLWTSSGRVAWAWLHRLATRLERVRVVHGEWDRCLNNNYGGADTAIFLDPPYLSYEESYNARSVARDVESWARDNPDMRIALCGHNGDYALPGWSVQHWSRGKHTYAGSSTTDKECIWYSPACRTPEQMGMLFDIGSVGILTKESKREWGLNEDAAQGPVGGHHDRAAGGGKEGDVQPVRQGGAGRGQGGGVQRRRRDNSSPAWRPED